MLLRFRGPEGTARIQIEEHDTFNDLAEKVLPLATIRKSITDSSQLSEHLPKEVDFNTLTLSNAPKGGDMKHIKDILKFRVVQIGVK